MQHLAVRGIPRGYDPGDPDEDDPTPLPPFATDVNPIPVSGPLGIVLLVLAIAMLGWGRLRGW